MFVSKFIRRLPVDLELKYADKQEKKEYVWISYTNSRIWEIILSDVSQDTGCKT